ncbi:MAG: SdrD B-like domain-containing protein [Candidatus Methanosuratincola sp.]|nr:SdrD B-like domain-containing protein [Candidatus Methanosuratincola sp.]
MRKIIPALLIVTMLLAAYPVALISVRAGYGNGEGDATHYPLIAGQTICLGEVLVWHNDTHLSVKYVLFDNATAEGWLITGIHLHANTSLAGIPNSNGNPIPGQFMVKRTYDPGVNSTEAFAIDLAANGWLCGVNLFIAAHADVERLIGENCSTPAPEELPQSVTMSISWPVTGGSYYFPQVNVTDGGILAGKYGGWCADTDRNIEKYKNYTAQVFSSLGTLPDGLVEYPGNLSKINWILNQGFVGKSSQGGYGAFTYGDVQRAIWELIDDEQSNSSLNGWDINRVNEILTGANQNGGFVPGCGQVYAILLVPVDDSRICAQIVIIERELGCACAPVYQRETAWGGTEEFPGASWARYILYELTCGGGATPPDISVVKDAKTSYTRTWQWDIEKSVDPSEWHLFKGDSGTSTYTIQVTKTGYVDSGWSVSGSISITNNEDFAVNITSVTDVVSPDIAANVEFPVTFPYMLGAGETLEGNYTAALPDASSRTNTLTVTLQNYDYSRGSPKLSGTTDFTVALNFSFVESEITEVDECITVTDDKYGDLGTVCYPDAPKTFIYSLDVGPYATPGTYYFDNTASFETNDQGINGSDSWSIEVTVQAPVRICGYKFYDLNANGEWDDGEPAVQGFRIQLSDASGSPLAIAHTDSEGWYCFEINDAGTYIVSEVMPCGWVNTTAASLTIEVLGTENGDIRVDFGNVCLEQGYGGKTIGFWSNKNGQALINSGDILALNGLNLYTPSGWTYPPFTDKTQIRTYLLSANARDMRWMLSAQLVGTMLNTRHGLDALTLVYVGPSAYVPTGFITIGEIMDSANDALTGNDRGAQGYWKGLLDDINNNRLYFVCEEPCDVVYP